MKFMKMFWAALLAVVVGSLLTGIIWILVIVGLAGSMEPTPVAVGSDTILKIDLAEDITDAPRNNPLSGLNIMTMQMQPTVSLYDVLRAIDTAAADDRIKGIYLNPNCGGAVSTAILEELRNALEEFKQSGKFVVSYNESYSQQLYYLASVADKVYIEREGGLDWRGLSFNVMFYKGLMDKLGITAEIFRPTACKYKSAVEPFFLTKMSDANRLQMSALANSMWSTMVEQISASRGIEPKELNRLADELAVILPEEALKHNFVDGVVYEEQMREVFADMGVATASDDTYAMVSLGEYIDVMPATAQKLSAPKIAIVYADGEIVDGYSNGDDSQIYGNSLAQTLAEVRRDDKVKAVVLRVNSPGGSAMASDLVWNEMQLLRSEKPVVVSMGAYAASGGYYISCPADVVVADRLTLTGSIGVFGFFPNMQGLMTNKLGLTVDGVNTNRYSDIGNQFRPMSTTERAAIMRSVDRVYDTFTKDVAQGRNLPIEKVLDIAGGRVWTGGDALGIGLIDTYGGLKTAIAVAADKAELGDNFRVTEVMPELTPFEQIFKQMGKSANAEAALQSELGGLWSSYKQAQRALSQRGVVMYYPYNISIE